MKSFQRTPNNRRTVKSLLISIELVDIKQKLVTFKLLTRFRAGGFLSLKFPYLDVT